MEDQEILDYLKKRQVGFADVCGIQYKEAAVGRCVVALQMQEQLKNPQGFAHGGLLATLMDVAAGSTGLFAHGRVRPMVTQSCSIQYLRPVSGPLVLAEGVCIKAGRRSAVVRVDVRENESGTVCASGFFELCYLDV